MSFCSVETVSRKQAMRVCGECCSKFTGANATQFFLFHFSRVYDPDTRKIVQKNLGHSDSVRCIIHIPERSQVFIVSF